MINSRDLFELDPVVKQKAEMLLEACRIEGIRLQVTSTYRDFEQQDALFAIGRTKPGKVVTSARGGDSFHNWRVAFDVVPIRDGRAVWGTKGADLVLWQRVGALGRILRLEWGGDWSPAKRDFPHFQFTGGLSIADFKAGKSLRNA